MSKERPQSHEGFEFTEHEKLYDRITNKRFEGWIQDEQTTVHSVELDSNNYGEFLFVTTSRNTHQGKSRITFWGLGFHEYRDRWITDEWRWYEPVANPERDKKSLDKSEVQKLLQNRQSEIAPQSHRNVQSKRGELFEIVADLTDDDGAIAELDEIENLLDERDE
jgi:hypothetical protein